MTGTNGAGKSQLLQMLDGRTFMSFSNNPSDAPVVTLDGEPIERADIVGIFDWSMPATPTSGMVEIQNYSLNIVTTVTNMVNGSGYSLDPNIFSRVQRDELLSISTRLQNSGLRNPTANQILDQLSSNFSDKSAQIVNERIAAIIYDWHLDALEDRRDFDSPDNPVSIFNALCADFSLDFRLPEVTEIRRSYSARLIDAEGSLVEWQDLSSGEQVIFRIICWLFYYRTTHHLYPRLLLLDEPDAHLTPRMTRRFLDNLYETIHGRMGIAVIMTTHSPNTVALCEERSLYELVRSARGQRVLTKTSRREALSKLSEGLLFVQEDTRLVFVEGVNDVPFYERFYEAAVAGYALANAPSIKFIAASTANPDNGGCTQVISTIARFADTSIESLVCGVIDRDEDNQPGRNLWVLPRYSIENFLYDPLIVCCNLVIQGRQAQLESLRTIRTGDWRHLVSDVNLLQQAADELTSTLERIGAGKITAQALSSPPVTSAWHLDGSQAPTTIKMPGWLETFRGKTLVSELLHSPSSPVKNYTSAATQWLAIETTIALPVQLLDIYEQIRMGAHTS
jgi:ABC-type molybdenum transport system ATPase subunit/photorepair protein PhrA